MPFKVVSLGEPKVDLPKETPPGSDYGILRGAARTVARVGETALGYAGDIAKGVQALSQNPADIAMNPTKYLPGTTAQQIREAHEPYTQEYTKPRTGGEETFDSILEAATNILLPGGEIGAAGNLGKAALTAGKIGKAVGTATAGEAAGWTAEKLGYDKLGQAAAKFGTMTALNLVGGRQKLTEQMKQNYVQAEKIAENGILRTPELRQDLKQFKTEIQKGGTSKAKSVVIKKADEILEQLNHSDQIKVDELLGFKRTINGIISDSNPEKKNARRLLFNLSGKVNDAIDQYARTNPEFDKIYNQAEDIWKGLNVQSPVTKALSKAAKPKSKTILAGLGSALPAGLIYGGPAAVAKGGLYAIPAYGTLLGAREISKFVDLINKNPTAQKTYFNLMKNSLAGNARAATKDLHKLDQIALREEPQTKQKGGFKVISLGA